MTITNNCSYIYIFYISFQISPARRVCFSTSPKMNKSVLAVLPAHTPWAAVYGTRTGRSYQAASPSNRNNLSSLVLWEESLLQMKTIRIRTVHSKYLNYWRVWPIYHLEMKLNCNSTAWIFQYLFWMNEWPFIPLLYRHVWIYTGEDLPGSVMLITRFTRECTHMFNDSLDNRRISLLTYMYKRLYRKIVLPHICQILRHKNRTHP